CRRHAFARGIKALVVACNTATSVAINDIRGKFNIPVIGMEPALKPAVENGKTGDIVVMATPLTLKEEKFKALFSRFNTEASIIRLPCPGLVELIESETESEIRNYLQELFSHVRITKVSSIVLGCTHYCFIKEEIAQVVGPGIRIVDGNAGTVRHLMNILQARHSLNSRPEQQNKVDVEFLTTGDISKIIPLSQRFLERALRDSFIDPL
ncbi:MAG: glutamate racemase, partial [Eubacteriales bacterium]